MRRRCTVGLVLAACSLLLASCAKAPAPDLDALMVAYYAALGTPDAVSAIDALASSGAASDEIAAQLRKGPAYADEFQPGWSAYMMVCPDERERPFHVYVPAAYDPGRRHPVLVYLHGGVRDSYTVEQMIPNRLIWEWVAAEKGYLVLMPHGDGDATWWSETGHANIMAALRWVKRNYNVDENRVFATGFSNGADGSYWLAMNDPTPWAGFVPMYGSLDVVAYTTHFSYPRNMVNRPLFACNGEYDSVYPAWEVFLYIRQLRGFDVPIRWATYPTMHTFDFFSQEREPTMEFFATTVRDGTPNRVVWETGDSTFGRCDWIRIDEIANVGNNEAFAEQTLVWDRVLVDPGIRISGTDDQGAHVAAVEPHTAAEIAGLTAGDVVVRINGKHASLARTLLSSMVGLGPGDSMVFEILRGDVLQTLSAILPEPKAICRSADLIAIIDAHVEGNTINVRARNAGQYTVFLSSEQFDFASPVTVTTNGDVSFQDLVEPDLRGMLVQFARDLDRTRVYEASLQITVEPSS